MADYGIFGKGSSGNSWFSRRLNDFHDSTKKYDPLGHYSVENPMKSAHWLVEKSSKGLADAGIGEGFNTRLNQEADENGKDFGLGTQRMGVGIASVLAAMYGGEAAFGGGEAGAGAGGTTGGFGTGESLGVLASDGGGGLLGGSGAAGGFGGDGMLLSYGDPGLGGAGGFAGDGMLTSYADPTVTSSGLAGDFTPTGELDASASLGNLDIPGSWKGETGTGGSSGGLLGYFQKLAGNTSSSGGSSGGSMNSSAQQPRQGLQEKNLGAPGLYEALAKIVSDQEQKKPKEQQTLLGTRENQNPNYRAVQDAGLKTDEQTMMKMDQLVGQGYSPDAAAILIRQQNGGY